MTQHYPRIESSYPPDDDAESALMFETGNVDLPLMTPADSLVSHHLVEILDRACAAAGLRRDDISQSALVRVSNRDKTDALLHQRSVGAQVFANHPAIGPYLDSITPDHISGTSDADEGRRRDIGLFVIRDGDITDFAETPKKRVGWLVVLRGDDGQGVLILLVPDTGLGRRVRVPTVGEFVAWSLLVRSVYVACPSLLTLSFARDSRVARDLTPFYMIVERVKQRPGGRLSWGGKEINPHTAGWEVAISAQRSTEAAEVLKNDTLVGCLTKLKYNRFDKGEARLPPGVRFRRVTDPDTGAQTTTKGQVEADAESAVAIERMAMAYGHGERAEDVARAGAEAGLRRPVDKVLWLTHLAPLYCSHEAVQRVTEVARQLLGERLITPAEHEHFLERLRADTASAEVHRARAAAHRIVASHFTRRKIAFLRTGRWHVRRYGTIPGRESYDGFEMTFEKPDDALAGAQPKEVTHGYIDFELEWPVPSIGVSDELWDACERRASKRSRQRQGGAAHTHGTRRPLAGLRWSDDSGARRMAGSFQAPSDLHTYRVMLAAEHELGPKGGFTPENHHATVRTQDIHRALGHALLDIALRADQQLPIPVTLREVETRDGHAIISADLRRAEHLREGLDRELRGLLKQQAIVESDDPRASMLDEESDRAAADLQRIQEAIAVLEQKLLEEPTPGPAAPPKVNLQSLRIAALALLEVETTAPAVLAEVLAWVFDNGRLLRLTRAPGSRELTLEVQARVPGPEGPIVLRAVDATLVDVHRPSPGSTRSSAFDDLAAKLLLVDRQDLATVAMLTGRSQELTYSKLLRRLSDLGITNGLRSALVTAPPLIPAPTVVMHALGLADTQELTALSPGYLRNVEATYLSTDTWSNGFGWLRIPTYDISALLAALASRKDGEASVQSILSSVPGMTNHDLRDLLMPGKLSHFHPPALRAPHGRVVRLINCPHEGCRGRCTIFAPAPEVIYLGASVLCASCFRTPTEDGADVTFPASYALFWDRRKGSLSRRNVDGFIFQNEDVTAVALGQVTMRIGEAAERLGLTTTVLRRLTDNGLVPSTWDGRDRLYSQKDLDKVSAELLNQHRRKRESSTDGGLVVDGSGLPSGGPLPPPIDEPIYLRRGEVCRRLGLTHKQIKRLVIAGLLTAAARPGRKQQEFAEPDVARFAATMTNELGLRPGTDLSAQIYLSGAEAARRVGIQYNSFLRHHIETGRVRAARHGGHYLIAENHFNEVYCTQPNG